MASSSRHILSAALGLILLALAGLGLFLPTDFVLLPGIGIMSIAFIVIYLLSLRLIYRFDLLLKKKETPAEEQPQQLPSLKKLLLFYLLYALITVGAALFIPYFANRIAIQTGLGNSFIGTVLVAASTSLPEITVSIAAVRLGSVDIAIGNLLGSNLFNILILAIDDLFYTRGILLKDASDVHLVTVFNCLIMGAIVIAGFTYRTPGKKFLMAIDALLILAFYLVNTVLLFQLTRAN